MTRWALGEGVEAAVRHPFCPGSVSHRCWVKGRVQAQNDQAGTVVVSLLVVSIMGSWDQQVARKERQRLRHHQTAQLRDQLHAASGVGAAVLQLAMYVCVCLLLDSDSMRRCLCSRLESAWWQHSSLQHTAATVLQLLDLYAVLCWCRVPVTVLCSWKWLPLCCGRYPQAP